MMNSRTLEVNSILRGLYLMQKISWISSQIMKLNEIFEIIKVSLFFMWESYELLGLEARLCRLL